MNPPHDSNWEVKVRLNHDLGLNKDWKTRVLTNHG